MDISIVSNYIYLGLILGAIGGAICMIFYPKSKPLNVVKIMSGCIAGVLSSIAALGMQVDKIYLVSAIMFGYVGASIISSFFKSS